VADPAFTARPDVPQGTCHSLHHELRREQDLSNRTSWARRSPGGARGEPAPQAAAEPPQHQTFQRQLAVYVSAGYVANTPAPFIVVQDGQSFVPEDAAAAADGRPRADRPFMPVMLDNLIHEKRIPPIVVVFLPPGSGWTGDHRVRHGLGSVRELRRDKDGLAPKVNASSLMRSRRTFPGTARMAPTRLALVLFG